MALFKMVDGISVQMSVEEEAAIRAEWATSDQIYAATGYQLKRQVAYPAIADQLDAIWKLVRANPNISIPVDTQLILAHVEQVKLDYPKPVIK